MDFAEKPARPAQYPGIPFMNPLLYKPHPLLLRWADLFVHPSAHSLGDFAELAAVLLAVNGMMALGLGWGARMAAGVRLPALRSYGLALPSSLLYVPSVLTVLGVVSTHAFHWEERFILVFEIFIASQMLSGFYTVTIRHRGGKQPIGLAAGLAVSLLLLLASIPVSSALLGLQALGVFPH